MKVILRYGSAGALLATLVAIVLSSCSAAPIVVEPTPTVPPPATTAPTAVVVGAISEQAAIAAALKYATLGDGHVSPAQEPPRNIQAKLVPADQARDQSVAYGVSSNAADSSTGAIWLITPGWHMDTLTARRNYQGSHRRPWHPYTTSSSFLDAGTGVVNFVSGRP